MIIFTSFSYVCTLLVFMIVYVSTINASESENSVCSDYPTFDGFIVGQVLGNWYTFGNNGDVLRPGVCPYMKIGVKYITQEESIVEIINKHQQIRQKNDDEEGPWRYYSIITEYGELVWKNSEPGKEQDYEKGIIKYKFNTLTEKRNERGNKTPIKSEDIRLTESVQIIDTDYKTYAVTASCRTIDGKNNEVITLHTRVPRNRMEPEEFDKYKELFKEILKNKMDKTIDDFMKSINTNLGECFTTTFDRKELTTTPWLGFTGGLAVVKPGDVQTEND